MIAYHNDAELRVRLLEQLKFHEEQDNIVQGTYGEFDDEQRFSGCDVGCAIRSLQEIGAMSTKISYGDHAALARVIGWPETLCLLRDRIHEGLPREDARHWPYQVSEAAKAGADLSMVWPRFALWLLADPHHGVLRHCNDDTRLSVEAVADLYRRWIDGDQPSVEEFEAAAEAAEAEAEAAWAAMTAEAAAASYGAAGAAEAAARAAEVVGAARAAAWAAGTAWAAKAAKAAAGAAAGKGFWIAARDELLRLLRDAPVAEETGL